MSNDANDDSPTAPEGRDDAEDEEASLGGREQLDRTRERVGAGADRALTEFDRNAIDALARLLAAETRARVYAALRERPHATVPELADAVDRYPGDVREALADLREEGAVRRADADRNSDADGGTASDARSDAVYRALPPRDVARGAVARFRRDLDASLTSGSDETAPVRIPVEERDPDEDGRSR